MVKQSMTKQLSVALLLLFVGGCGGPCSRSSKDKLLYHVGNFGVILVNSVDIFVKRYGVDEGAHPERASWRAYCMTLASDMDMPRYDRTVAWDSEVYEYLHQQEFKKPFQIREAASDTDYSADFMAVVGEGTAFASLAESGSEAIPQLPRDSVLLVAASTPSGSHWMECVELEVADFMGPDGSVLKALPKSPTPCGRIVHFVDGQTWMLESTVPEELLYKLFTIQGAREHDRDELLSDFRIQKRLPTHLVEEATFGD